MSDQPPKRPVGRPPLTPGDTPARVHLTLPSRQYDQLYVLAQKTGVSVPELVRRGLSRLLPDH